MGVSVAENVTTVNVTGDTTVTVTENVTSVSASSSTATITVNPAVTNVSLTGNTTAINVTGENTAVNVTSDSVGTSGTQKIDDGTLEISVRKNAEGLDFNKPLLHLTTIQNRSSGKMIVLNEQESTITDNTAALGKVPNASFGSLFIGVSNCGLHMSSSITNFIIPCNAKGEQNDNTISMGTPNATFKDIYATDTTINTSDRNKKQDITALSESEKNVAISCKGLLKKYKWKQSVEEKGGDARWHFGIIAQELETAFADQGLDASDYGVFIKEEIETDGVTKTHYAVRYNELLAFIIATI